jgi:transcriptional regulator with XRE-family HTH domain|nr:MAG TPA: helix-turn-helix domain protein [Bacteriophage sp.]
MENNMNNVIPNKLKDIRKHKNITQEQLAEKLDISRSKVSSWETNRRDITMTDAINLVNLYNISLDNLFNPKPLEEKEYIELSERFFSNPDIKLKEKVRIIKLIENSLKNNNINELYENYINDTKCDKIV